MYPVLSVLRRAAVTYVYVRPELLASTSEGLHLRLETETNYLLLREKKWSPKPSNLIPLQELVVEGMSSEATAIALSKAENEIAAAARLEEMVYTMVFGPEQETELDGMVRRSSRYAVLRGVYRAHGSIGLQPVKARGLKQVTYSRGRQPVIRLD